MAVPTWISAIGHFFGDIVGGAVGATVADLRRDAARKVGEQIRKDYSVPPDIREIVMKDLLLLREDGQHLRALLIKANQEGFVRDAAGKRYLEARLVDLLAKVESGDRGWVYRELDLLYGTKPDEFFALLNVINDDGWLQLIKLTKEVAVEKVPDLATFQGADQRVAGHLRDFRSWLAQRGVK